MEKGKFPVVLIHSGEQRSLELVLRQIHKVSPKTPICFLAANNRLELDFVQKYDLDAEDLQTDLEELRAVYRHCSPYNIEGEFFCIKRWFLLRNFMRRENMTECLHLDSDVLLFCDVEKESRVFKEYEMTIATLSKKRRQSLIHCNFIRSREALESFCRFVLEFYSRPDWFEEIRQVSNCWISDMTLFDFWSRKNPERPIAHFEDFYEQGIFFDSAIAEYQGVRPQRYLWGITQKHKKVFFVDRQPFGRLANGTLFPYKCIHYQGDFKFLLESHFQGFHPYWQAFGFFLKKRMKKLLKKIGIRIE